jgi:hypothetical protein
MAAKTLSRASPSTRLMMVAPLIRPADLAILSFDPLCIAASRKNISDDPRRIKRNHPCRHWFDESGPLSLTPAFAAAIVLATGGDIDDQTPEGKRNNPHI